MVHTSEHTNKLINEKSPYLLQHAYNPVDWHPWNEEAFEAAKRDTNLFFYVLVIQHVTGGTQVTRTSKSFIFQYILHLILFKLVRL